jgi:dienelactone hydrolase
MDPLTDFSTFTFAHHGKSRTVYRRGTGPAVIIMHEIPGIMPEVARVARYVVDAGMTEFMPHLFGVPYRAK